VRSRDVRLNDAGGWLHHIPELALIICPEAVRSISIGLIPQLVVLDEIGIRASLVELTLTDAVTVRAAVRGQSCDKVVEEYAPLRV
jgi:hypothetical protein